MKNFRTKIPRSIGESIWQVLDCPVLVLPFNPENVWNK
jgi:hypothetical protein